MHSYGFIISIYFSCYLYLLFILMCYLVIVHNLPFDCTVCYLPTSLFFCFCVTNCSLVVFCEFKHGIDREALKTVKILYVYLCLDIFLLIRDCTNSGKKKRLHVFFPHEILLLDYNPHAQIYCFYFVCF